MEDGDGFREFPGGDLDAWLQDDPRERFRRPLTPAFYTRQQVTPPDPPDTLEGWILELTGELGWCPFDVTVSADLCSVTEAEHGRMVTASDPFALVAKLAAMAGVVRC